MRHPEYSSVDPNTGNVIYRGYLSIEKGDHSHMPARTEAYLPGDERGHVNASSLNGSNSPDNVVPQGHDVNHGGYLALEQAERATLKSGATIYSEKTAFVNGQPGERPSAFLVSDTVTYADGHTETIHHSFANASYAEQDAWNEMSPDDAYAEDNPMDDLRSSMDAESYAALMEELDADLPSIQDDYAPSDYSGLPGADVDTASAQTDNNVWAEADGDNAIATTADDSISADADTD